MKIRKNELIIVIVIFLLAVVGFFGYRYYISNKSSQQSSSTSMKFNRPSTGEEAIEEKLIVNQENADVQVIHGDDVIMLIDSSIDGFYDFEGDYGTMHLEVKDGYWRITEEECPNHICSSVGFVNASEYFPILCIPNNVAVYLIEE